VSDENQAREDICRVGRSLFERGYVHATAGNISVRLDEGFLITPTDACLGTLDPARLAHVNAAGGQIAGDRASRPNLAGAANRSPLWGSSRLIAVGQRPAEFTC
jgi:ribulose-5-phosphate 4-epimerase/fuculose-1-phosphate aldolase